MEKKRFFRTVSLIFLFIILQTYFQNNESFKIILNKWLGYFIPVIWALILVILLNPMTEFIKKKIKVNQVLAVSFSIIIVILCFLLLVAMIIPQIITSIKTLNSVYPQIVAKSTEFGNKLTNYLAEKNIIIFKELGSSKLNNYIGENANNIRKIFVSLLENIVSWTIGISNFFMGLFLAIIILLDKKTHLNTRDNFISIIFGIENKEYIVKKIDQSNDIFINYIVGKILVSFVVGLSVFVILLITKTPYAALSAVMMGIGNMIPYIGSIVGGFIATILILLVSPIKVIFLFIAIIIAQFIDGFVIGPKIIGDKVGLSTFWVMVSVIVFGGLFGLVGMFLGVPIACIIKLFYEDLLEKVKKGE